MTRRCCVAATLVALVSIGACQSGREIPLETLRDLADRQDAQAQSLADIGQAPLKRHPAGIDFLAQARFVESSEDELARRAFHVEIRVRNDDASTLRLDGRTWWLRDDAGERFSCRGLLRWNPQDEVWEATDGTVPARSTEVVVAEFPVPMRYVFEHMMRVTLHWQYAHASKVHRVATGFRSR